MQPDHLLSRRDLLTAGLVAAGGLALGGTLRAGDPTSPYGPFKMGLQSYSLRHFKLGEAMNLTQKLGLHYWESFPAHVPTSTDKAEVASFKDRMTASGVKVIGYGVVHFGKDEKANRKFFDFAKLMGIEYLSCDPDPDCLDALDKLLEEYGIPVGIHNHGPGHRYDTVDKIHKVIKDHSDKLGCCVDTGHFLRSKEDPVRAVEVFDKRVYGVHLKDVKDATKFTILGEGDLRNADLLKALAKRKYDYCLALEYEENEKDPIADIRACLATVKKAVAGLS